MMRISESSTGRAVKVRGLLLLLLAVCLLVLTGPGLAMVTGAGVGASAVVPEAIEHSLTAQRYDADATIDQRAVHAHGDDVRGAYDAAGHLAKNVAVACPGRHSFQPPQPLCDAARGGGQLSKQAQKGIRSLEKRIAEHEKKLADFRANPTPRPGTEGLSREIQQQSIDGRIQHLEKEIQTFRNNIEKLRGGGQ